MCNYCDDKGLYPFCPKCYRSIDLTIQHMQERYDRQVKRKQQKDFKESQLDEARRFGLRERQKSTARMIRNMVKVKSYVTGDILKDQKINAILAGKQDDWFMGLLDVLGEPEEWPSIFQPFSEILS